MKKLLFIILLSGCHLIGWTQTGTDGFYRIIKEQADRMHEYHVNEDFERYATMMHPMFIQDLGGVQKTAAYLKQIEENLHKQGFRLKQHQVGELSPIIHHSNQLQAILTRFLTYSVEGGSMLTHTHWFVVSEDHGNTWKFLDVTGQSIQAVVDRIPQVSSDLVIPATVEPIFLEEGRRN